MLLHRITFVLVCLFFVKKATAAAPEPDVEGSYTDWIKKGMQGQGALTDTLGKLMDKFADHVESSRTKIAKAVAQLQEVMKTKEYSKCSKNILGWIKNLDGHDFSPCYNEIIYNTTVKHIKNIQGVRQDIPPQCMSKSAMADPKVMSECVDETGKIVMKHMQQFEGGLKDYTDALKETSKDCVITIKKKFDTFVDYINAGCPDGKM